MLHRNGLTQVDAGFGSPTAQVDGLPSGGARKGSRAAFLSMLPRVALTGKNPGVLNPPRPERFPSRVWARCLISFLAAFLSCGRLWRCTASC